MRFRLSLRARLQMVTLGVAGGVLAVLAGGLSSSTSTLEGLARLDDRLRLIRAQSRATQVLGRQVIVARLGANGKEKDAQRELASLAAERGQLLEDWRDSARAFEGAGASMTVLDAAAAIGRRIDDATLRTSTPPHIGTSGPGVSLEEFGALAAAQESIEAEIRTNEELLQDQASHSLASKGVWLGLKVREFQQRAVSLIHGLRDLRWAREVARMQSAEVTELLAALTRPLHECERLEAAEHRFYDALARWRVTANLEVGERRRELSNLISDVQKQCEAYEPYRGQLLSHARSGAVEEAHSMLSRMSGAERDMLHRLDAHIQTKSREVSDRVVELRGIAELALQVAILVGVLSLVLGIAVPYALMSGVLKPLTLLRNTTNRLTAGDHGAELKPESVPAEFQDLAGALGTLARALREVKQLEGLLPICAWCKSIRDDQNRWRPLDDYMRSRANVTHSICPDCLKREEEAVDQFYK